MYIYLKNTCNSDEAMLLKGRTHPYVTRQQMERTQNIDWNPLRCRRALARHPLSLLVFFCTGWEGSVSFSMSWVVVMVKVQGGNAAGKGKEGYGGTEELIERARTYPRSLLLLLGPLPLRAAVLLLSLLLPASAL